MANDKAPPAPQAAAAETAAANPAKKSSMKLILVAVSVLALEIGTVIITVKMAGGPRPAAAAMPVAAKPEVIEKDAEVKLVDAKLPNSVGGVPYLYDLQVVAKVSDKNKSKVTELFAERDAEIRDQIRAIIASSDPKTLAEPGLEILKRQIGYQLEQDIGKDLLKEVLIPKCTRIQQY